MAGVLDREVGGTEVEESSGVLDSEQNPARGQLQTETADKGTA